MAQIDIDLIATIHAEIAEGNFSMQPKTSVTIDPISKSYSDNGLTEYNLSVVYSEGVSNIVVLHNGKNSRISAEGQGYFQLELIIFDKAGLMDNDIITVTVG
jgi:hypothetical protein